MRQAELLRRLRAAQKKVNQEISGNASKGHVAGGLASEGYAGGYLQALFDVEALLVHGHPSDPRRYWQ